MLEWDKLDKKKDHRQLVLTHISSYAAPNPNIVSLPSDSWEFEFDLLEQIEGSSLLCAESDPQLYAKCWEFAKNFDHNLCTYIQAPLSQAIAAWRREYGSNLHGAWFDFCSSIRNDEFRACLSHFLHGCDLKVPTIPVAITISYRDHGLTKIPGPQSRINMIQWYLTNRFWEFTPTYSEGYKHPGSTAMLLVLGLMRRR